MTDHAQPQTHRQTPTLGEFDVSKPSEVPDGVVPLFGHDKSPHPPTKARLIYDIFALVLLVIDLMLIAFDNIMMSALAAKAAALLSASNVVASYAANWHDDIDAVGGLFTLFWVLEISIRWLIAVVQRTYYRWFFFPFVHWYEILSCFPALRALRLLRLAAIIRRLHGLGIKVIPERWISSGRFYYHVVLEELSDRVILTAIDNFRAQLVQSRTHGALIQNTINKNRAELETVILSLLRRELAPKLQHTLAQDSNLSQDVGKAIEQALANSPELSKYLKLIPIAGALIETQITHIGRRMGIEVTDAINRKLLSDDNLDTLMIEIAKGISSIDTTNPELQNLVATVLEDGLDAFEQQIKVQQWKHREQLPI